MSKELTKTKSPWSQEQVTLITNTVAKGATPDELKLFLYTAQKTGLDPLTRQIHFVKRKTKNQDGTYREQMTIQTGIDGYRVVGERSGTLAGIDDAVFDDETQIHPNKASVTVWRIVNGERVSFTASARWSEYAPQGTQGFMWNKMPYLMLAKCAEALALRKAFPNDLSGVYTNEEMAQADNTVHAAPEEMKNTQTTTAIQGEVVENKTDEANFAPQKQCPNCQKFHTGKYPKCLDCWKAGTTTAKTKTLVNDSAAPFKN